MIFDGFRRWFRHRRGPESGPGGSHGPEMVSCRAALERIYEYMDGELDDASHEQMEEHFRVCASCYPHLRLERTFRRRVQAALSKPEVPADLRDRVLDMLARDPSPD